MRPHVSGTERVGFSKQDARGNLVVASPPVSFLLSELLGRRQLWTSAGLNMIHTFLSHKILVLALAKLCSTAQVWNHQGISKLVNRLIVACLWQLPSALLQGNSAGLPRYEYFAAGISTYPCHLAFIACLMTAFFALCYKAIVRTLLATMLRSGIFNLCRVVLLWYCSWLIGK